MVTHFFSLFPCHNRSKGNKVGNLSFSGEAFLFPFALQLLPPYTTTYCKRWCGTVPVQIGNKKTKRVIAMTFS